MASMKLRGNEDEEEEENNNKNGNRVNNLVIRHRFMTHGAYGGVIRLGGSDEGGCGDPKVGEMRVRRMMEFHGWRERTPL